MRPINKILASFVCFLSLGPAQAALLDRVVAVVNDDPVLQSEVLDFQKQLKGSAALASIYHLDAQSVSFDEILQKMIEEKVVHAAVKELEMPVTDADVDTQIASISKQNNMNLKQLQDSLDHEGIPFAIYKRNIHTQMERKNILDREIRGGGGVSETELRALYDRKAKPELDLGLISAKNAKELAQIKEQISSGQTSSKQIQENLITESLGWVSPESLDPKVATLVEKASTGQVVGPVKIDGRAQLVYVQGRRKGSDEEFQKTKGDLAMEARFSDNEKRFASWLDRKKSEMHILINKQ